MSADHEVTEPIEDSELLRVLEVCLAEIEAGRPVDVDRLTAGNLALASRLRTCLAGLHAVEQTGAIRTGAAAVTAPAAAAPPSHWRRLRCAFKAGEFIGRPSIDPMA